MTANVFHTEPGPHLRVAEHVDQTNDRPSDLQLIGEAQAGRESSFEELVRRYMPLATAFALGYTRFPHEVDDIVQDAFVDVYAGLGKLRDPARFAAWLRGIVRHHAVNHYRKRARFDEFKPGLEENLPDNAASADQTARVAEIQAAVLAHLSTIKETYRVVLYLHLVTELPANDIADRLGLTPEAVRVRVMRGLNMLRKKLARAGIDARMLDT